MRPVAIGLVLLGWLTLVAPASAATGPCTDTTEVTTFGVTGTSLATRPAVVCGVSFIATAAVPGGSGVAGGFCQVSDSPDGTINHAQARVIAEPSAATVGNSAAVNFEGGYRTRFGLAAASDDGRCIIHWGAAP